MLKDKFTIILGESMDDETPEKIHGVKYHLEKFEDGYSIKWDDVPNLDLLAGEAYYYEHLVKHLIDSGYWEIVEDGN